MELSRQVEWSVRDWIEARVEEARDLLARAEANDTDVSEKILLGERVAGVLEDVERELRSTLGPVERRKFDRAIEECLRRGTGSRRMRAVGKLNENQRSKEGRRAGRAKGSRPPVKTR